MVALLSGLVACERETPPQGGPVARRTPDSVEARFRNVATDVAYVGDSTCVGCHAAAAASYASHSMARSFHAWTPQVRVESTLVTALPNTPTGFAYRVVDSAGALWQVETRPGDTSLPVHEQRRRMDYVMGSGRLARTYFTEENGRLFQLPLTWYANHGWDFSPGYEINNARFARVLPDRCIACHASYPVAAPHLEGKYPTVRPGIGCERCHGPGALHVSTRTAAQPAASAVAGARRVDSTIVNPARLPLERRLDVCEQCHVHTSVAVLRAGRTAFDFTPASQLAAQYAYFKNGGDIDLVSHADRLRQSACFRATASTSTPLECASCHNPHQPPPKAATRSASCVGCHTSADLSERFIAVGKRTPTNTRNHRVVSDCVGCHMPVVKERTVPHGTFSDHWIRVVGREQPPASASRQAIDPYFARDREGPESALYTAMGTAVFASLANDGRAFDIAAVALATALASGSANAQAHFLLGVSHQARGRLSESVAALKRAVALEPDKPELLRALAQAQYRQGDTRQARTLYERALALQPALAWVRAEYAELLLQSGALTDAEREYRAAVAEQPSLSVAWFHLGVTQLLLDRPVDAGAALLRAVQLDPMLAPALDAVFDVRTRLERVRQVTLAPSPAPTVRTAAIAGPMTVRTATSRSVVFSNVPPGAYVLVTAPDGTLLLAVPTGAGGEVIWDLRTGEGDVLGSGLYRAHIQAPTQPGVPTPQGSTYFVLLRR